MIEVGKVYRNSEDTVHKRVISVSDERVRYRVVKHFDNRWFFEEDDQLRRHFELWVAGEVAC